jgi:D-3-phosphoglycerate dehydrogenase / 2-oxoglutarate reductase
MNSDKPRVVVTDWTFPELDVEKKLLESEQIEIIGLQCKTENELVALVAEADAVITQFAKITPRVIGAMKKAKAIVRYGIGVDNVDLQAARDRNIPVCNIPEYCIDEVADQTLAFILATTRQVVPNTIHLREGKWGLPVPLAAMQTLKNMTVGLIGFGRIGREVASRLKPCKCRVLVVDPVVPPAEITKSGAEVAPTLESLLEQSDIVSAHCPSNDKTRRMFNAGSFAKMKSGAIFINVGRGDLMDCAALVDALQTGRIAYAALDVFDPEPIPAENPIRKMPNVILSAHIASASVTSVRRLRESAARIAAQAVHGHPLPNIVNGVK